MKQLIIILCTGLLIFASITCTKNHSGPIENDGVAPGAVSNPTVENLSGSAVITYTLPSDADLLYVKAVYTTERGIVREAKASYYTNKITLTGFGSTNAYEVKLYAVDKGENSSAPLTVTVNPLKPAYQIVGGTIQIGPDFGGINVSFKNPGEDNIAIVILSNDSLSNFITFNTVYTKLSAETFSSRGFKPVKSKFGVYIRDRWGNISDTTIVELTPYLEVKLDKSKIRGVVLPNDAKLGYGGTIAALFNDINDESGGYYCCSDNDKMPQWFTFDLGSKAKLSRLSWWMRNDNTRWFYNLHNPRNVEIWGSNDPAPDGSWASWTLLATHEQIKPSGLPVGQLSNDDIAAADAGESVLFPLDAASYRYIRFKTLRNWSDGTYVNFDEISLWGQPE